MSVEKIRIEEVCDIYPLTSVQKGILYHSLCDGDGMYLENVSLRLHGSLCPEIVEKAWQAVTDHNDCLRTVFRWEGLDTPVQIVLKKVPIAMEFYTQKDTPPAVQFDLHQVPFLIRLVCLSELDYIMSIYTHHILLDGWSTSILIEEFIMFYSRIISGDKSAISNKKNEFKEYVYEADKNQNEYWNEYLHNYKEREFLPRSSPDELKNDSCPHCPLYFRIPKSEITNFSQKWKITLSALANACWALLYHTILGTEDVLFGTTVSTRTTEYSHSATGLFINTIPFRLKIDKKDTVLDILMKSLQSANSRLEYEKTSLSDIKKSVGFLDDQELFDTIVVVENYPVATAIGQRFGGLIIEGVTSFERNNYALCLGVDYKEEEVQFSFLYDSSAYTSKYVEKLMKQFEIIIRQVLIDPNKPLGQLSFIDQPQQIKIQRFSQNQFYEEKYSPNSILTNFDRVVALYADRIAIKFWDQTVTYRELSALTYVNGAMIASACREEPVSYTHLDVYKRQI